MLVAGTDTSATTVEWVMALFLNHPEALAEVQIEIDSVVGHDRLVEDSDLQNLTYLQSVSSLKHFDSIHQPRSHFLMNPLRMPLEPELWEDLDRFVPERFGHGRREYKGYKSIPFGVGRRACPGPGATLGRLVVGLIVGALIQCFKWQRFGVEEIDMAEGSGCTMPPATPVEALCKPREKNDAVSSQFTSP
ncbi:cytochrome P450 81Q32-like [Punica granatum]|uniref:Cytochrome P450 81Q32-like n=2 Tax=Punica granatum TaxID=22663 RepID=A0A6P8EG53_PUNGR|nr:cytochrome P450 81Q32-like [Punica granatum]PKI79363.1 hypothetical protein CRG98_000241 [Punica granatum]